MEAGQRVYLLDCGAPVATLLHRYNWKPTQIARLFLSHFHADHVAGLPTLLVQQMMEERHDPLPVVGPPGTSRRVQVLLELGFLPIDALPFPLPLENAATGVAYGDAALEVQFFPTTHLQAAKSSASAWSAEYVAYGMRLRTCGHTIVYSGDVGSIHDVEPALEGCELLIHEFGHVSPDELATLVRDHAVPALIVTHLHHSWAGREALLKEIITSRYSGKVWIASDGFELTISRGVSVS